MEKGVREAYGLLVPSEEHHALKFTVEFIEKEDETKWMRMSATVDGIKIIAWYEWERE